MNIFELVNGWREANRTQRQWWLLTSPAAGHAVHYRSGKVAQLKTLSITLIPIDCVIYRGVIVLVSIEAESSRAYRALPVQIEPSQGSTHWNPWRAARRNFVVRLMTVAINGSWVFSFRRRGEGQTADVLFPAVFSPESKSDSSIELYILPLFKL